MVKKLGKYVACEYCGKIVWRENNRLKNRKSTYCSPECYKESIKQPMDYTIVDDYATFNIYDKSGNRYEAFIDLDDIKFIDHKFFVVFSNKNKTYCLQDYHGKKLHRLIMKCPKNLVVDHINHNPLDNRKSNLRICTRGENNQNKKSYNITSTTKFRNVYFKKDNKKYFVKISVNNKNYFRGYFPNTEAGFKEAQRTAIELRKEIMPYSTN